MAFGSNKNVTELVITGDNKSAVKAIHGTVEQLDQAERKIQRMSRGMGDSMSALTYGLTNPMVMLGGAAFAAAGGITALAIKSTEANIELIKMRASTGLSVAELSALQKISERTGLPMKDLVSSFQSGNDELKTMANRMIVAGEVMSTNFAEGTIVAKQEWEKLADSIGNFAAKVVNHDLQWIQYAWEKTKALFSGEDSDELESFAVYQLHQRTKIRLQYEEAEAIRQKIEEERKAEEERKRAAERWQRERDQKRNKQLAWSKKGLEGAEGLGGDIMPMEMMINTHDIQMQMIEQRKQAIIEVTNLEMWEWALMNDMAQQTYGNMAAAAGMFYELSGQKSKEWFAVQKGFSIAQAVINTYEGATKALAQGGIFGPILAASVIAFGLAQVATIAAQQPGGGAYGGGGGGSIPSAPTSGRTDQGVNGDLRGQQKTVTYNFYFGPGMYIGNKDEIARELGPAIRKAISDGVKFS